MDLRPTNATITDALAADLSLSQPLRHREAVPGTSTVTCNFGNLAKGSSATVNIVVVPQAIGQLSNTVSVAASEMDPDMADNSSSIVTTVTTQRLDHRCLIPICRVKTVVTG